MPETATPEINPALKALFDLELPEDKTLTAATTSGEETLVDDSPAPPPRPARKAPAKEPKSEEKVVAPSPPEPKKADELTARLAPDFAAEIEAPLVQAPAAEDEMPEEPPEHVKGVKAREDYKKWQVMTKRVKNENLELKARIAATPAENPETLARLKELEKQNSEYLEKVARIDFRQRPDIQRDLIQPRLKDYAAAKQIAKDAGVDPVQLDRAMGAIGTARADLLDEIIEHIPQKILQQRFTDLINSVDKRTLDLSDREAQAEADNEAYRLQEKADNHERMVKMEAQIKGLLGSTRRDLADEVKLEVLHKVDKPEFEWWNKQVDEIDRVAEEILLKSTPEKAAVAAYLAASAGAFRGMWQEERKARLAVEAELADYKGASPKLSQERKAPPAETNGFESTDILGRLRAGEYRK